MMRNEHTHPEWDNTLRVLWLATSLAQQGYEINPLLLRLAAQRLLALLEERVAEQRYMRRLALKASVVALDD